MVNKIKVVVVVGPTAVGKTALGITLAKIFNGEIVSGDSQQVYKQLDVGTAKANLEEQSQATHHLIDIREVYETYSAYDFVSDASRVIENIYARGKLPIIVGGTGLYLQSLLEGYHLGGEVNQDEVLAYRQELDQLSDEELIAKLSTANIEVKEPNRRRMIRALEHYHFSGNNLVNHESPYEAFIIGLNDDRSLIYDRINRRVDKMLESGLLEEARWLFECYPQAQSSRGIGYKELFPYFRGKETLEEGIEKIKQNSRRFAKRQLTWFRNRMSVNFYPISDLDYPRRILDDVRLFLEEAK